MSNSQEIFFTVIGCMDGRVQDAIAKHGQQKFNAVFPDTITEAGIVGILAQPQSQSFVDNFKTKVMISIEKHHSVGILIDGHEGCAGDPVEEDIQKEHIRSSVLFVTQLISNALPVSGVYVKPSQRDPHIWEVEDVGLT